MPGIEPAPSFSRAAHYSFQVRRSTIGSRTTYVFDMRADDNRVARPSRSDPPDHHGVAFGSGRDSPDARVRRLFGGGRLRQPGLRALYRGMADRRGLAPARAV